MPVLDAVGSAVLVGCLALLALALRRYLLQRSGAAVDVSLRLRSGRYGRGWALGVGRYENEQLAWYRVFSFAPRPRCTLPRRDITIERRRTPNGPESMALLAGSVVLECRAANATVELAMSEQAATGFLAWLESAPPGPALMS